MAKAKENFIIKSNLKHNDDYDYSKVEYINNETKVCIICPKHGEFWQTPHNHLKGQRCPKCSLEARINKRKKTTEQFIEEAKKIHGDKYDYSKVEYINNKTKVRIICPKHGEFLMKPDNHLSGQGCPTCWLENRKQILREKIGFTKSKFIEEAKKIHGDKYDYSKVEYINSATKVCIICPKHGEFWQTPDAHLLQHQGCPTCGAKKRYDSIKLKLGFTQNKFIDKAKNVHGEKYDYSKVEYINSNTKVCIICPEHGEFWQIPSHHLKGVGCPICKESKLEKNIRKLLNEYSINFIQHASKDIFPWIKNKHLDFYLPNYNIAIECQGEQHFKSVKHFGGDEKYEKRKLNDKNKKIECEKNGIKLIYYTNFLCEESKNMFFDEFEVLKFILDYGRNVS